VCSADAYATTRGNEKHVSTLISTVMTVVDRGIED